MYFDMQGGWEVCLEEVKNLIDSYIFIVNGSAEHKFLTDENVSGTETICARALYTRNVGRHAGTSLRYRAQRGEVVISSKNARILRATVICL
mgnify:CR=1 FL=1